MAKGKILGLILIFIVLTIISVMFIANLGEMKGSYAENTTFYETGERVFGLFNLLSSFIIPLAIVIGVLILLFAIMWTFSQAKGGRY